MGAQSEASDDELVRRASSGGAAGRDAFAQIVVHHQGAIVRLLRHLLGNQSDAEDVAQEVFVRAYKSIDRAPQDGGLRPWLRVIGTRLAFNYRRDQKTRRRYNEQASVPEATPFNPTERAHLEKSLERLPYPYREVLVLRYVEEMQVKDIAALLHLGESAARMRLLRAREAFSGVYNQLLAPLGQEKT